MRGIHGEYRRIDLDSTVHVRYLRATPLFTAAPALSKAQNRAMNNTVHEANNKPEIPALAALKSPSEEPFTAATTQAA